MALGQANERDEFRRAFAAATVHSISFTLCVVILPPIEAAHYLRNISEAIVNSYEQLQQDDDSKKEFLSKLTKPIAKLICQVDKKVAARRATRTNRTVLAELEAKSLLKTVHSPAQCIEEGAKCVEPYLFSRSHHDMSDQALGSLCCSRSSPSAAWCVW